MCLATLIVPSGHWFWLSLAGLLLLSIACLHTTWIYVSYVVRRRNLDTASTNTPWPIPDSLFIPWMWFAMAVRAVRASRWVKEHVVSLSVLFGVGVGLPLGWLGHAFRQFDHTDGYRMHVIRTVSPYNYLVEVSNGKPFVFAVCQNMSTPEFEAGETDDVVFEEQSTCKSFSGTQYGWRTVRDERGNIIKTGVAQ